MLAETGNVGVDYIYNDDRYDNDDDENDHDDEGDESEDDGEENMGLVIKLDIISIDS